MKRYTSLFVLAALGTLATQPAMAGGVTFKDGDKYVKFGGRIQLQYHLVSPDGGQSSDDTFFRRFRPYIEGSIHKDWKGKFQWDMGKAEDDNELVLKDAYMQYKGDGYKVTIGNKLFPFSREGLTSSKYQQLVERTFVGDHNYGTPDRQTGIYLDGGKDFEWSLGLADARLDPDANKLDFDTAVNNYSDWNQGFMVGGRVSYHPFGHLKMKQGDFKGKTKATISAAAFSWSNDSDNNSRTDSGLATDTGKPDVDSVSGVEVSAGLRMAGLSLDAQFNQFDAKTVDSSVTKGIYKDGATALTNWAVEGGYMVVPSTVEVVVGMQSQDADGYAKAWERTSFGINWFLHKHDVKVQLTQRQGKNLKGVDGANENETFLQTQYVF